MRILLSALLMIVVVSCARPSHDALEKDDFWQHVELKERSSGFAIILNESTPVDINYTPLITALKEKTQTDSVLTLVAAYDTRFQTVSRLFEALSQAGYKNIKFAAVKK